MRPPIALLIALLPAAACNQGEPTVSPRDGTPAAAPGESSPAEAGDAAPEPSRVRAVPELTLQVVDGLDPIPEGPIVYVSRDMLWLGDEELTVIVDGELDPRHRRDHLITTLYQELEARSDPEATPLLIAADAQAPFMLLIDVMYTAGRAGYSSYGLIGQTPSSGPGVLVVEAPRFSTEPRPESEPEPLLVTIDPGGFAVRDQQRPAPEPERIGVRAATGHDAWDFEALTRRSARYWKDHAGTRTAAVSADEDVPFGVVLRTFDAIEESGCAEGGECSPRLVVLSPGAISYFTRRRFDPEAAERAFAELEASDDDTGTIGKGSTPAPERRTGFSGRGRAVPKVRQGKATVDGPLDRDIVRRIVRAHINEIRSCYTRTLNEDPEATGEVEISFEIGATGKVSETKVVGSTIEGSALGDCMAEAAGRWTFPKPAGGEVVRVSYPFVLEPG